MPGQSLTVGEPPSSLASLALIAKLLSMENAKFGMIGLGVMGRNFLLNVAENGFSCVGYDLDREKVAALNEEGKDFDVVGLATLEEFVAALERPR